MEIQIHSTEKMVHLNGIPARIWEGVTGGGIKIHAYITRVAVRQDEVRIEEFEKDLQEHATPSHEIEAIPLRMIL